MSTEVLAPTVTSIVDMDVDAPPIIDPSKESDNYPIQVAYQSPDDVRVIKRQSLTIIMLSVITGLCIAGLVYKTFQKPDILVVDRTGDKPSVRLEPDQLSRADMEYLTRAYLAYLYGVDMTSRSRDIESAIQLMIPSQAQKFARYLVNNRILKQQREEQWNATWTIQNIEHDTRNPLLLKVLGKQEIDLVRNGTSRHVTKHLMMTSGLVVDEPDPLTRKRRRDRNLNSGFRVISLDYRELSSTDDDTPLKGLATS